MLSGARDPLPRAVYLSAWQESDILVVQWCYKTGSRQCDRHRAPDPVGANRGCSVCSAFAKPAFTALQQRLIPENQPFINVLANRVSGAAPPATLA